MKISFKRSHLFGILSVFFGGLIAVGSLYAFDLARNDSSSTNLKNKKISHTQQFELLPTLHYNNRYVKGKIAFVEITNSGKPIVIDYLGQEVILGENDSAQFKAPNVDYVALHVSPYHTHIMLDDLWTNAHTRTFLFRYKDNPLYKGKRDTRVREI